MRLARPADVDEAPLEPLDLPDPLPGPGEVVIETRACAVCRTDLQIVEGDLETHRHPLIPGHQAVGPVVAVGAGVGADQLGRMVGVGWLGSTCGQCDMCHRGLENLCRAATFTGWDRDGGYASRLVARADFCHPMPEGMSPEDAAPLLCGGIIGYRAYRLAGVTRGDRLGLFGFGASALLVCQLAVHAGCEVYVVTRGQDARRRAMEGGAIWAGDLGERSPRRLHAAITFAPVGSVVVDALESVDRAGVVVVNAIHLDRIPDFPYRHLYWERRLLSVANFTRQDGRELLELANRIPIRTVIERHSLDDANLALQRLKHDQVQGAAVLIP
ncbi:MAG: zinc-binding alcohol dehydrogenase family protein [Candidatus Dormibacteria bacterium]